MKIRLAQPTDTEAVLKLLDEIGEENNKKVGYSPHNTEAQKVGGPIYEEILSRKDTMIFVAEEDAEIVGVVTFYILPNLRHGGHRGHIEDCVVSKKVRGKGIGSKLFDAVKEYCRQNNINVFKLDSSNELIETHKFYEKNGGKQTEKMFRFDIE
ncbi:MAG: GNAT family N-acetyltransferase [Candidatus Levyibacteriota bacterium]